MNTTTEHPAIYTESTGCTTYINGERGTLTGFTSFLAQVTGAFVRLDERPAMLYVTLGRRSSGPCDCPAQFRTQEHRAEPAGSRCRTLSGRTTHHEFVSAREVDRDEFDRLTAITELRAELGWR